MTKEQLCKLMSLVNGDYFTNEHTAGMMCLPSVRINNDFKITDTGVTNHITPHEGILSEVKPLIAPFSVGLPNNNPGTTRVRNSNPGAKKKCPTVIKYLSHVLVIVL